MPLPLIPIAISLASRFAPSLIGKLTGSDTAAEVAEKVVDMAKVVTGQNDPTEAAKAIEANPELALEYQRELHGYELALKEIEYKKEKLAYEDQAGGRDVVKTALVSDDPVVRRARPQTMVFIGKMSVLYAFYAPVTVIAASYALHDADLATFIGMVRYIAGFLFGAFMAAFTGYTVGRSADKRTVAYEESGVMAPGALQKIAKMAGKVATLGL